MSLSIRVAKQTLKLMGKSKQEINSNARAFASILEEVVVGRPKNAKKEFYKAYEALINIQKM